MGNTSIIAIIAASVGFASVGPAVAMGGMGDPSANMRHVQEICDKQRCGEYPPNPTACLPDYPYHLEYCEHWVQR